MDDEAVVRQRQASSEYPIGTVIKYGPDDKTVTKIVASVIPYRGAEPILERFVGTDIDNPDTRAQILCIWAMHGVTNVVKVPNVFGCPHEEGPDFPVGEDCPFCPFWKGKQGSKALRPPLPK
jgi:hypothetical protein